MKSDREQIYIQISQDAIAFVNNVSCLESSLKTWSCLFPLTKWDSNFAPGVVYVLCWPLDYIMNVIDKSQV